MDAEILKPDDDRVANECPDDASDACPADEAAVEDGVGADADQKEPSFVVRPNGKLRPNKGKIRGKYPTCLLR